MSDGGYSRLEKDFLGNERMVHYDGSGNMVGASDVVREPDGTIRVTNDSADSFAAAGLPDVKVVEPTPKPEVGPHIPDEAGQRMAPAKSMPMGQTVTYIIATFVGAMIITFLVLKTTGGRGNANQDFRTTSTTVSTPNYKTFDNQQAEPLPERAPDQYPPDPKPRNDEQPDTNQPYDQSAPDMNSGDDNHPKIEPDPEQQVEPAKDPKKGNSDDPIDLRGDGEPTKKDPPKDDPNDIH